MQMKRAAAKRIKLLDFIFTSMLIFITLTKVLKKMIISKFKGSTKNYNEPDYLRSPQ